ncbi:laminin subunit alpha-1-like [Elysia marginata]|uniref:Laminin subunit alpha-1-like n=1 Tax=Elysia marginata TaxID=1093978 RepID=A0AAV4FCL4_9GAST|nr:laminin subunit alpha-1-like [Elysia marginata]
MVDGETITWWQSTSRSRIYHYGTAFVDQRSDELEAEICLDLLQEFLAERIILQLGDALTPQRIVIEKSLDNVNFVPWVYATSNLEWCSTQFNVDIRSIPETLNGTVCVSYAADDLPPGDTISLSFAQVPGALKEWSRIRYIKIRFYDMLFIAPFNALANSYNHYSVAELTVMAECPCNALQTGCVVSNVTGMYECECGGNTRGRYCETCQPLFNQYEFEYGKPCTECNCFDHASSCFYEEAVEAAGESIDISGQRAGGGVCIDCKHNTDGNNCEKCVAMYFRPANVLQTSEGACVPCGCNPSGSTVNPDTNLVDCVMNNDVVRSDGKLPGECFCKANVQGSKCDTCKPQFFNLLQSNADGCTACECYTSGTVGASELCTPDALGQCTCKANVKGRACNQCKDGFYGLSGDDPNGCTPCGCDVGGSVNQICNKLTGQCLCRSNNIVGRTCNSVKDQFYYPSPHSITMEFEDGYGEVVWERDEQFTGFSGNGYVVLSPGGDISSLLQVPEGTTLSLNFTALLFYSGNGGGSVNISVGGQTGAGLDMTLPPCGQVWCQINSAESDALRLTPGPNLVSVSVITGNLLLDKLVAFPIEFLNPTNVLSTPLPAGCDLLNNVRPTDSALLAACDAATFSLTMYYWSSPFACNCDMTGSTSASCEVNGGQCPCRPGVVDRTCDKCSPDHYNFGPTGCAECSCDDFSTSCDQVTGQCECPDNTFGRQCQFCLPNHWDWHRTEGCKPCQCNDIGSSSLQCNLTSGICDCKAGVEGDNCDVCKDGFHSLGPQGCLPCSCNPDGSVENVCNKTTGQCPCKGNVEGVKCTVCTRGTFGLGTSAALGCQDCVCMGITRECSAGDVRLSSQRFPLSVRNGAVAVPNVQLSNQDGSPNGLQVEVTTDLPTALTISPTAAQQRLYWKTPDSFISNLLKLYGTDLTFTVNYVVVDGSVFTAHEVLLLVGNAVGLRTATAQVLQGADTTLTVSLRESSWTKEVGGASVTRSEFLKYLATADAVLVPASFSTGSFTARLSSLSFNVENSVGTANTATEKCVCGVEYTGGSCEECALGYKRTNVSISEFLGVCVPCECNGHSALCDADTGVCENCLHDTTGDSCETCKVGFYGDATTGTSNDCTPCPCFQPRVVNATCHANVTDNSVVCDFCREGYVGDLCDSCDNLYYGNPAIQGGTCSPCECNGNTDSCDSVSGLCSSCGFNTTGDNCESCITGFYGNASNQACQECGCISEQSTSAVCDAVNGQCPCVSGVGGRTCSYCQLGFWGFESTEFVGCRACGCVEAGSTSVQCDNSTGLCSCRPNTSGDLCDTCDDGFFGLPTLPCEACGCDTTGTVPGQLCDKTNGQCQCQPGVGGRQCDQCDTFFVNFTTSGCSECGQCQKSLGEDITRLMSTASTVQTTAAVVQGVQGQDVRLQRLAVQLNTSLVSLGLSNTETSSATEIVSNMTGTRDALVAAYGTLQNQADALETATNQLQTDGQNEYNRQRQMSELTTRLTQDCNAFERTLENYINIATQYSNQASQYADAGSDPGTNTLNFNPEIAQAQAVLAKVQDTASMEATRATVLAQSQQLTTLNDTVTTQYSSLQEQATILSNLSTSVTAIAASLATADYDLEDGQEYKSQADELVAAVETILTNSEEANTEARTALSAARAAVRNTNSVLTGDARTVMTGEDYVPFPTGAANFITASDLLRGRITSLTGFIGVATPTVVQAEAALPGLENTLNAVNSTYLTIPQVATDAVLAISNFEEVITDLGNSITMATDANDLLSAIRTNVSGDAFEARRQEYEQEKTDAEALRTEVSALELQPQALLSSIQSATSRLNNEPSLWAQVDTVVVQMTTASNALNSRLQDNSLEETLTAASNLVREAGTIARTVEESTSNQDAVLTQKEEEVTRTEQAISDVQGLEQSVSARLTAHETRRSSIQANIGQARSLSQAASTTSQQIEEKIRELESKLDNAETLLSQLRQPLTFDGSLGLTFSNPGSGGEHLYDEISLEVRKPGTVNDGVMFFVDDSTTVDELQIGLKDGKVYFQYAIDTDPTVLESPAVICADCWVRVDAIRYGRVGHLSVTALSNGGSVSTSSPVSVTDTSATISLTSNIYVGTIAAAKETTKVANRQFTGCLHNVEYQGELLNLWTTAVTTSATATCCSHPPTLPGPATVPGNSFSGLGYLVLSTPTVQGQPILMSETRQVDVEFRTFSPSATIFLVQNADATGYVSISLLDGSVIWEILINGQLLRTQVPGPFNTGQWVQVSAQRADTSLSLSVKFTNSSDPPTVSVIAFSQLDLTPFDNKNYILGAESDPLVEGYAPTDNNFAGCMRNLAVGTLVLTDQQISFTENVVRVEGVTSNGCIQEVVNGARFTESAFVQFSPVAQLGTLRTLEVQFVTDKSSAILVFISELGLVSACMTVTLVSITFEFLHCFLASTPFEP